MKEEKIYFLILIEMLPFKNDLKNEFFLLFFLHSTRRILWFEDAELEEKLLTSNLISLPSKNFNSSFYSIRSTSQRREN